MSGTGAFSPAAREIILALADDELCIGQHQTAWVGVGPFLEEDLAFISIAQDELAHARALFRLVAANGDPATGEADVERERQIDQLAMGRSPQEFRSSWLAEDACPSWAEAFVRHALYDEAEAVRWEALCHSSVAGLGPLAGRILVEEEFHRRHARPMLARLLTGTDESRRRMIEALERLLPLARCLFEPTVGEAEALAAGVIEADAATLEGRWQERLRDQLASSGYEPAWPDPIGWGGRRGERSADFAALYTEMRAVYVLDPLAHW